MSQPRRNKRSDIVQWFHALGDTPSTIHRRLHGRIQGTRNSRRRCPLARILSVMYPGQRVVVHSDCIEVGALTVTPPAAITRFIERFDAGLYDDLDCEITR